MVTHDYYKLLGISMHSSQEEIKLAYRRLALRYHPDRNPEQKDADLYFKIITDGYNTLSDENKRKEYDSLLTYYQTTKNKANSNTDSSTTTDKRYPKERDPQQVKERVRKVHEMRKQKMVDSFLKKNKVFPLHYRYTFYSLMVLSGLLMAFNNWFVNEDRFGIIYIIFGYFIYNLGFYFLVSNIYAHLSVLTLTGKKQYAYERIATKLHLLFFFMGPILILTLTYSQKVYHLNHYAAYTYPVNVELNESKVMYRYKVNNVSILKSCEPEFSALDYKNKKFMVKYSEKNPNISELILAP